MVSGVGLPTSHGPLTDR